MKKDRRSKLLVIVALALTLVALTVGFAAFTTTLNISSNATVTPNEEDFNIMIYGFKDREAANNFSENGTFDEEDLSPVIAAPILKEEQNTTAEDAAIVNSIHRISNIKVGLTNPGDEVFYYLIIKNEGKYDAYLDLTDYTYNSESQEYVLNPPVAGICTPKEGATESLVDATCNNVLHVLGIVSPEGNAVTTGESILEIPKGEYILLASVIGYQETENRADGPFDVSFPDLELYFSTAK